MPQCSEGQQPWELRYGSVAGGITATGSSAAGACNNWFSANAYGGWTLQGFEGNVCTLNHPSYGNDIGYVVQVCATGGGPEPEPEIPGQIRIDAVDGHVELTVQVGTQTIVVTPEPVSDERIADMGELFMLFLFAGLVVFCSRSLYDLVRSDTVRD